MKKIIFTSNSESETIQFASDLAKKISYPSIITLNGDLGAGKTTFSRGFARGLGVEDNINSPTFPIIQEYLTPNGILYHMDLYRINNDEEALAFGIDEFFNNPNSICLIEWPQRLTWLLPKNIIEIQLSHISESVRQISITSNEEIL